MTMCSCIDTIVGTSRLHRIRSANLIMRSLMAAGCNEFDVSPLYGLGFSDYLIKKNINENTKINCKVGYKPLYSSGNLPSLKRTAAVVQAAYNRFFSGRHKINGEITKDGLCFGVDYYIKLYSNQINMVLVHDGTIEQLRYVLDRFGHQENFKIGVSGINRFDGEGLKWLLEQGIPLQLSARSVTRIPTEFISNIYAIYGLRYILHSEIEEIINRYGVKKIVCARDLYKESLKKPSMEF